MLGRGERIVLNLAGSNTLARQIAEGAPVDLFISADGAQMDRVEQASRILAGSRVDLLSNQLVVVVPERPRASLFAHLAISSIRRSAGLPSAIRPPCRLVSTRSSISKRRDCGRKSARRSYRR